MSTHNDANSGENTCAEDAILIQKVIRHRSFVHHFCQTVDPIVLLPCTRIRDPHKEVVRKKNNFRRDDANLELLHWVKKEHDWERMLLIALKMTDYLQTLWRKLHPNEDMPGQSCPAVKPSGLLDVESRFLQDFELCCILGRGGFGYVFEAKHKTDGQHYAVKVVGVQNDTDTRERERMLREVTSLASLSHPGIIRYFSSWWESHPHGWEKVLRSSLPTSSSGLEEAYVESVSSSTEQEPSSIRVADLSRSTLPCKGRQQPGLDMGLFLTEDLLEIDGAEFPREAGSTGSWMTGSAQAGIQGAEDMSVGEGSDQQQVFLVPAGVGRQSRDQTVEGARESAENMRESWAGATGDQRGTSRGRVDPRAYLCIQTELCGKKTLKDLLGQRDQVRDGDVPGLFRQIVEAVAYIHRKNLIHRDLKPSNIFLVGEDLLKIGDFGLVTKSTVEDLAGKADPANPATRTAKVGTTLYMSPEQAEGRPYNSRADIYALGIVYLELLVPFGSGTERAKVLADARRLQLPQALQRDRPRECGLLRKMLSGRADERPTAEEILTQLSTDSTNN